jgi:hypothetical protein
LGRGNIARRRSAEIELGAGVSFFRGEAMRVEEVREGDVSHPEADGGERVAAEEGDQLIKASSAEERAWVRRVGIEYLKHDPRVVIKSACEGRIEHGIAHPALGERFDCVEQGAFLSRDVRRRARIVLDDREGVAGRQCRSRCDKRLRRHLRLLVEQAQIRASRLGRESGRFASAGQEGARVYANDEVALLRPKRPEEFGCEADDLQVGLAGVRADEVDVKLVVLAQTTLLWALIPEDVRDREPAEREGDLATLARDHARESRCHLGAERHPPVATIGEGVGLLVYYLFGRLDLVEFGTFKWGSIIFFVSVCVEGSAHPQEEGRESRPVGRIEITDAFIRLGGEWFGRHIYPSISDGRRFRFCGDVSQDHVAHALGVGDSLHVEFVNGACALDSDIADIKERGEDARDLCGDVLHAREEEA